MDKNYNDVNCKIFECKTDEFNKKTKTSVFYIVEFQS